MSAYQNLTSVVPDGYGNVTSLSYTIDIDGTLWSIPQPVIPIGGGMAIAPEITRDGTGLHIHLDRWIVYSLNPIVAMPVWLPTQATAVAFARDFDRDPAITFAHSHEARHAWSRAWLTNHPEAVAAFTR